MFNNFLNQFSRNRPRSNNSSSCTNLILEPSQDQILEPSQDQISEELPQPLLSSFHCSVPEMPLVQLSELTLDPVSEMSMDPVPEIFQDQMSESSQDQLLTLPPNSSPIFLSDKLFFEEEKKRCDEFYNNSKQICDQNFYEKRDIIYKYENNIDLFRVQIISEVYENGWTDYLTSYQNLLDYRYYILLKLKNKLGEILFNYALSDCEIIMDQDENKNECPICFEEDEKKIKLLCGHIYHKHCIKKWFLKKKDNCLCIYNCDHTRCLSA